jgi:enamine deaminase RidA (YjgF/YER057c/UK114 family)
MDMLVNSTGLECQYAADQTGSNTDILAKIVFDARCTASAAQGYVSTGLPLLAGSAVAELFASDSPVTTSQSSNYYWSETDSYLFVALWANETEPGGLNKATETLYGKLLADIQARGYPHLVRVWNYFADINGVDDELERYRQFCIGRFNAFEQQQIAEAQFPSACALGHQGGDLLIYALASKTPAQHFENPRQASAYHYPAEYGPRSPSFARASLLELPNQPAKIFVSGTASVVGHVTRHPDDLKSQIQETITNLGSLLEHISAQYRKDNEGVSPTLTPEVLKVYVRHAQDLETIQQQITLAYPAVPTVYVAADICRSDLLLEVDGIWNLVN